LEEFTQLSNDLSFDVCKDKLFQTLLSDSNVNIVPLSIFIVSYKDMTKKNEFLVFFDKVKDFVMEKIVKIGFYENEALIIMSETKINVVRFNLE